MNIKTRNIILVVLFIFIILIIVILFDGNKRYNYGLEKSLETYQSKINGKIDSIEVNKGTVMIKIYGSEIEYLLSPSRNYDFSVFKLSEFLLKDDSIFKENYSDSLRVYRENSEEYIFVIGKNINKK